MNRPLRTATLRIALTLMLGIPTSYAVAGPLCTRCGQVEGCHKTCRLVKETKKVQVTCWSCQNEDFCIPYRSTRDCKNCDVVCDDPPDAQGICSTPKKFTWWDWIPGCGAHVHTKKKLMKRTVTKTIPSYKWVVEDLCDKCQVVVDQEQATDAVAEEPHPAPVVDGPRAAKASATLRN